MASVGSIDLLDETITASKNGDKKGLQLGWDSFVGFMRASNSNMTSIDCDIEHSADGVTWVTLASLPQLTADGSSIIQIPNTTNVLPNVRAVPTFVGTDVELLVRLHYDGDRA